MDQLSLDIIQTERTITRCAIQVKQLNRRLIEIQTRYDDAVRQNNLLWTYKLRMRVLTVEGVKDVFMRLLVKKMAMLEDMREIQYWNEVEAMGIISESESESEEEEDTTFRIISTFPPPPSARVGIVPEGRELISIDEEYFSEDSSEDDEFDSSLRTLARTVAAPSDLDIRPDF